MENDVQIRRATSDDFNDVMQIETLAYPRHGFKGDAESAGFFPPYPLPREYADYWMYQYLTPDTDNIPKGRIRCTTALDKPQHWRE